MIASPFSAGEYVIVRPAVGHAWRQGLAARVVAEDRGLVTVEVPVRHSGGEWQRREVPVTRVRSATVAESCECRARFGARA